ncbi:MAG: hypothetical protein M0R03_18150 [Novosphingobium sp.]|nr:hypothetical protein [Novosphingobium sp.]
MEEKRKSRNIPIQDYISILQLEYLSYMLRSKIYRSPFKEKYIDFCEKKKETIKTITLKVGRASIFTDDHIKQKYADEFFNNAGLPNFQYRDDYQRGVLGIHDKKSFFSVGTRVEFDGREYYVSRNLCYKDDNMPDMLCIQQSPDVPWIRVCVNDVRRIDQFDLIEEL